ncbi:DUF763 domain-containing protein [[Eubacterium] cellulosolvens]
MANLPLHGGTAPRWLFTRMVKLAEGIMGIMLEEHGQQEVLRRLSDPFWFQALGCVLGFDWHSSGVTTVTCGALKEALDPETHGLAVAGGKGKVSRKTPEQIMEFGGKFNLSTPKLEGLKYSSKLAAKVDTAAVQDNHQLYHHVFFFDEHGNWTVVQQGLDPSSQYARRYHWLWEHVESFIEEPHEAILGDRQVDRVLDMTSGESRESRKLAVDLVRDNPNKLKKHFVVARPAFQETLDIWYPGPKNNELNLSMPKNINWARLRAAYEVQPKNYEELIAQPGIGPATVRALALVGELIYGTAPSWRDPVKFSFTVGGKDGVPYPVDRDVMDRISEIIKQGIEESKVGKSEQLDAIKRLRRFVPKDVDSI